MARHEPLTAEMFQALPPLVRGYVVYMFGERDDESNVPNESNPYPKDSQERKDWDKGQQRGVQDAQDLEE